MNSPGTTTAHSTPCRRCKTPFEVTGDDLAFYDMVSPVIHGKKEPIPPPTHCPDCRQQRRLALSNEFNLYSGTCALCGGETLTEYTPHLHKKFYCRSCWNSDKWDPRDYGRDVDFSRPFFEQLRELKQSTPAMALNIQGDCQNSEYIHLAGSCKNCYLIMHADFCEDCYYGYGFKENNYCVDGFYNLHCEFCYDCITCHRCYGLKGSQDCINCNTSAFLRDCIGCNDCFLSTGLREKKYCFMNQQLSREDYQKRIAAIDLGSYPQYQACKAKRRELELKHTFMEYQGHNLQNSFGNYLMNCKDTKDSFDCEDVEGGKFCYQVVLAAKNIYDIYQYGTDLQQSYECSISGEHSYHLLFCNDCHMSCVDVIYCWYMDRCKNCFGCVDMHDHSYCILNTQYTKEEYEKLVPAIIEHMRKTREWGEFFPITMALHAYNKSSAQLYYPLTPEEAKRQELTWDDGEPETNGGKVIAASALPDSIDDIPDDVFNWAIECEVTKQHFKITPRELLFYRKQRLPIPRRHWKQRHLDRLHLRNPRKFWKRQCAKCNKEMRTTYSPDRLETVYCEACYLKTVY